MSEKIAQDQINILEQKLKRLEAENDNLKQQIDYAKDSTEQEKLKHKVETDRLYEIASQRAKDVDAKTQELQQLEAEEGGKIAQNLADMSKGFLPFNEVDKLPLETLRRMNRVFTGDAHSFYHKLYMERHAADEANKKQGINYFDTEAKVWKEK